VLALLYMVSMLRYVVTYGAGFVVSNFDRSIVSWTTTDLNVEEFGCRLGVV
jgi:hypothetical protein